MSVKTTCLGFPRIGKDRELKRALESYWTHRASADDLARTAADLRRRHWLAMKQAGIDQVTVGDFSLYDHVLDTAIAVGAVPDRFQAVGDPLARLFAMARGLQDADRRLDLPALEMTKWFDTNYHYIVPELAADQGFTLDASKLVGELDEARELGLDARPVLLGPVSFLLLCKTAPAAGNVAEPSGSEPLALLDPLLAVYREWLAQLAGRGVEWVQLDEPYLVCDLDLPARAAYRRAFDALSAASPRPHLLLTTYFGDLGDNLPLAADSGLDGLHLDLARAPGQLDRALAALPLERTLSLGVVDGRNIWRTNLDAAHRLVRRAVTARSVDRVWVGPSCSLLHVPVDLAGEEALDDELRGWMAFAAQKLEELRALADAAEVDRPTSALFEGARRRLASRANSARTHNPAVRRRAAAVDETMRNRRSPYAERAARQQERFRLPILPTTTIGSFPQTADVRKQRAAFRQGRIGEADYRSFLEQATRECIRRQEAIGLDVLAHGEFERNDMVEYFGEQLEGFAFTRGGWVQSYGSRCVKPPILYGDVARPAPMTVVWSTFAQSLTDRPVKGMLTGPVTILQWSFVRDDQPRGETCAQIALALRDEVRDLESAGIAMIQVDEPAIREGLPLRRSAQPDYLRWAVDAFRLATSGVRDDTQIHTHMCYSAFGDMLESIAAMDADVLSIEASRSGMELLADFVSFHYPNAIGPGVYDIHSPRVPSRDEMAALLERAIDVLPPDQLWVNPDCGLKTRDWPEVLAALQNLVQAARLARAQHADSASP